MNKEIFVQNVKKYCELRGVKPTNACKESGVGSSFLSDVIHRGRTPSVTNVQILAQYLGVTTSELLGEEKRPTPDIESEPDERRRMIYERLSKLSPENLEIAIGQLDVLLNLQEKRDKG